MSNKSERKKYVPIRNIEIGSGVPKICVPIVSSTKEAILNESKAIHKYPMDMVEWRVDFFEDVENSDNVLEVLKALRSILKEIPLLFTFRTKKEGGQKEIKFKEYIELNKRMIKSGDIDLIDIELFIGNVGVSEIINEAHKHNVKVIVSNHDFNETPSKRVMIERLKQMQDLKADIAKIAVMANDKQDVLMLLETTLEASEHHLEIPIVTMSMGAIGIPSRICGELFGSAITFGSINKASAPGQIEVEELSEILKILHNNFE